MALVGPAVRAPKPLTKASNWLPLGTSRSGAGRVRAIWVLVDAPGVGSTKLLGEAKSISTRKLKCASWREMQRVVTPGQAVSIEIVSACHHPSSATPRTWRAWKATATRRHSAAICILEESNHRVDVRTLVKARRECTLAPTPPPGRHRALQAEQHHEAVQLAGLGGLH